MCVDYYGSLSLFIGQRMAIQMSRNSPVIIYTVLNSSQQWQNVQCQTTFKFDPLQNFEDSADVVVSAPTNSIKITISYLLKIVSKPQ